MRTNLLKLTKDSTMDIANHIADYIVNSKPYILLPAILLVTALLLRVKPAIAVKASLTIGIGFIGIFIIFDYFVAQLGPAVKALVSRTGLHSDILDVGWPPLALISWSYRLAPLMILLVIAVNIIMLVFRLTRTVNIDIWNFWHFNLIAALVTETTGSMVLAIAASLAAAVVTLKLADLSAASVNKMGGFSCVAITTFSAVSYFPVAVVGDRIISRISVLNKINADPENLKKRFGILGEPAVIGFILGVLLGAGAGYDSKQVLELAFAIAAVIFILPMMSGTLGHGLVTISNGIKDFIQKRYPGFKDLNIGLDCEIIMGNSAVVVTALLLMPAALLLSFILPGVKFIPIGDLANIVGAVCMIVAAVRGNVIRAFIISLPILIGKLYIASKMAGLYTTLGHRANFGLDYQGMITSFLDGGNLLRFWIVKLFGGAWWTFPVFPFVILIFYLCYRFTRSKETCIETMKITIPGKD